MPLPIVSRKALWLLIRVIITAMLMVIRLLRQTNQSFRTLAQNMKRYKPNRQTRNGNCLPQEQMLGLLVGFSFVS